MAEPKSEHRSMRPPLRVRLRHARRGLGRALAAGPGRWFVAGLARTWRIRREGEEHLVAGRVGGGHFMALWHGSMIVALPGHRGPDYTVLVSQSGDGDISARLLGSFGHGVIRGSASRGGARALREMLRALEGGGILVVTPDGPRGPRHSMNPGLAWMARATGRPIVPCAFVCDRAWRFSSWDRLAIPRPFARVAYVYGEPVAVARDVGPAELDAATELVRERIFAAEHRAHELLGLTPEPRP